MAFRIFIIAAMAVSMTGCFWGDEYADERSTSEEIKAAASRCGIENFAPTRAGDGWAAYVDEAVKDHKAKEDCIYDGLTSQGRVTTR
ncbi:MAG: hypothetical protein V4701_12985 [Pseudomonadota bacterium]